MRRIVLFSTPCNNENFQEILNLIFPKSVKNKRPLFMPSQGRAKTMHKYFDDWDGFAKEFNVNLEYVDNCAIDITNEKQKLKKSNILIISGDDPFQLLLNLRKSGFDSAIKQFTNKEEFILAGYSAGAYVLTPTLEVAKLFNENYLGGKKYMIQDEIEDFSGLGIVNFEICAHYSETHHKQFLEDYIENNRNEVKLLGNNDFLIIDL